jgi:DHA1 family tetracycline resistance protein-like MFS transporter
MNQGRIILWSLIIVFIDTIISAIILPSSMQLLSHLDLSIHQTPAIVRNTILASGIIFLLSPSYLIASPVIGWLCDNLGRTKSLLICLFCALFGYAMLFISNYSSSMIIALFGILLINADSSMVAVQAIIIDNSQGIKRAYFLGLIVFIMLPAYLFFAQLAEDFSYILVVNSIYRNLFMLSILVITLIIILLAKRYLPETKKINENTSENLALYYSLSRIFLNKKVLVLLFLLGLLQFGCGLYFEAVEKYLEFHFSHSMHTISFFRDYTIFVMSISLLFIYPLLLNYFSIEMILFLSLLSCFLGALGSSITHTGIDQWLFSLPLSLGEGIGIAAIWMLLSHYIHPQDVGFIMGIKAAIWALAWSFSVIVSHIFSHYFSLVLPIHSAAITLLIAVLLANFIFNPSQAPTQN